MMNLIHCCAKPLQFNYRRKYETPNSYKPNGFWVSVQGNDDWEGWCRGENFCIEALQYAYTITIGPDANILLISTATGMEDFHRRYAINIRPFHTIAWDRVQKEYDGLIIAPYRWSYRLHPDFMWYYGWDCASGCIWNLDAIKSVSLFNTKLSDRDVELMEVKV